MLYKTGREDKTLVNVTPLAYTAKEIQYANETFSAHPSSIYQRDLYTGMFYHNALSPPLFLFIA
jgi:hypothetical protein